MKKGQELQVGFSKKMGKVFSKFHNKFKTSLGPEAESLIAKNASHKKSFRDAEKQLRDAKNSSEKEKDAPRR